VSVWTIEMKVRAEPAEVEQLVGWLRVSDEVKVTVSEPNEAGMHHIKVEPPIAWTDDIEAATSNWDLDHPGAILPPDDWMPDPPG
jgi:hypothetical protein